MMSPTGDEFPRLSYLAEIEPLNPQARQALDLLLDIHNLQALKRVKAEMKCPIACHGGKNQDTGLPAYPNIIDAHK